MAKNEFDVVGFLLRVVFAMLLVFGTYNPTAYSYASWVLSGDVGFEPVPALVGVALLIAWIVFLRATFLSLGWLGIILGAALFSCFIWLLIDMGWLSLDSSGAVTWVALLLISLILATGMSWSHIRRRLTGQVDVDDIED
jgi:hypothetical protein